MSLSFSVTDGHVVSMGKLVSQPVAVGHSRDALGSTTELQVICCDDTTNGITGTRLNPRQLQSSYSNPKDGTYIERQDKNTGMVTVVQPWSDIVTRRQLRLATPPRALNRKSMRTMPRRPIELAGTDVCFLRVRFSAKCTKHDRGALTLTYGYHSRSWRSHFERCFFLINFMSLCLEAIFARIKRTFYDHKDRIVQDTYITGMVCVEGFAFLESV